VALTGWSLQATSSTVKLLSGIAVITQFLQAPGAAVAGREPTITTPALGTFFGNLISLTPVSSAPVAPQPISHTGTEIVYAISGTSSTGHDTRGFGFVSTPSSHYAWQTANGGYAVIPYAVHTITATLISDGDFPLDFDGATVASSISGYITPSAGTATVSATTCADSVPVGSTCSVTISYDPTTIKCTSDAYGYAYTKIDLSLVTDAGANTNFTQGFTITGVPMCDD
jgi:hypothetical protein